MTHDELAEIVSNTQPYQTGMISRGGNPTQFTVCTKDSHIEFYATREASEAACRLANARAVLAVIYAEAEKWPTPEMENRYMSEGGDAENAESDWRAMLAASPLNPKAPANE